MYILYFHTDSGEIPGEYIVLTNQEMPEEDYKDEYGTPRYDLELFNVLDDVASGAEEWAAQLPTDRSLRAES